MLKVTLLSVTLFGLIITVFKMFPKAIFQFHLINCSGLVSRQDVRYSLPDKLTLLIGKRLLDTLNILLKVWKLKGVRERVCVWEREREREMIHVALRNDHFYIPLSRGMCFNTPLLLTLPFHKPVTPTTPPTPQPSSPYAHLCKSVSLSSPLRDVNFDFLLLLLL